MVALVFVHLNSDYERAAFRNKNNEFLLEKQKLQFRARIRQAIEESRQRQQLCERQYTGDPAMAMMMTKKIGKIVREKPFFWWALQMLNIRENAFLSSFGSVGLIFPFYRWSHCSNDMHKLSFQSCESNRLSFFFSLFFLFQRRWMNTYTLHISMDGYTNTPFIPWKWLVR